MTDAELVRAAQAGDIASLGALLERHRALLAVLANVCRGELRRPAAALEPEPVDRAPVEEAIERIALRDWVWTALERLSEPLRLVIVLRHFSSASSYEAIAELCDLPIGTVRSRLNAARAKLADELLATAAGAHDDAEGWRRLALDHGAAMTAFQRTGQESFLRDVLAPDLRFALADRVPRQGRDLYAALLASDFEDGVTAKPLRVIPGARLAVIELRLASPPDQPLHCPPQMTQVQFHDDGITHRIATRYSTPGHA
jgi:RNA polymerase sigma factor (sigma-70 family)